MKKIITGTILLASLLMGAEAFPRQLTTVQQLNQLPGTTHRQAMATRAIDDDIINEAPAGTHKSFYRDGSAYTLNIDFETISFEVIEFDDQYVYGDVVEGEDGFYYFRNPVMGMAVYSYMKGEKQGDEIVFALPQPMTVMDDMLIGVSMMELVPDGFTGISAVPVAENNEVRFTINADGSYTQVERENCILGYYYMDDDSWTFLGTAHQTYHPFNETPAMMPENADVKVGQMVYNGNEGCKVNYAVDGDKLYISGIYPGVGDGCAVGTIDGDKVTFEPFQYLGVSEADYHYVFFLGMDAASSEEKGEYNPFTMNFDAATSTLSGVSSDDVIYANASAKELYYLSEYVNPVVSPFELKIATPSNPIIQDFTSYEDYGMAYLQFTLPLVTADGLLLDTDHYYYTIYMDDEVYEFYPDEYPSLTEVVSEMPYNFNDGFDISKFFNDHALYIFGEGYEDVGVQSIYEVDGVRKYSDIVYVNGTNAVSTVDASSVVGVGYFDLNGRSVSSPANGIFVKKVTFSDGTSKTYKVVVR